MKSRICSSILLLLISSLGFSQSFMNEWIDHSKTYYRFKVGAKGVCRISKTQLNALGIGQADASHFQLWRRGEEIPVYTSVANGVLPDDGFLEFWGESNDGRWETRLYIRPEFNINPEYSLFSDTSVYFLTINTQGNNKRLLPVANNTTSSLTPDAYFMHKELLSFRDQYVQGFAALVGTEVWSSSYDNGEGYASSLFAPGVFSRSINNLFIDPTGPNASLKYTASGRRLNVRNISVSVNDNLLETREMNYYNSINDPTALSFPVSLLASNNAKIDIRNLSEVSTDRMVVGMLELTYPRQFNLGGRTSFEFQLPANPAGNKLVIKGFNSEGVAPVLYDLTNGYRIVGAVDANGDLMLVLPPSAVERRLVLASHASGRITGISNFSTRNFINYRF
jgi:hypothetical protein